MNDPDYDLHSWSKLYREDALHEAQRHHLEHRAKAQRRSRAEEYGRFLWLGKLAAAVSLS